MLFHPSSLGFSLSSIPLPTPLLFIISLLLFPRKLQGSLIHLFYKYFGCLLWAKHLNFVMDNSNILVKISGDWLHMAISKPQRLASASDLSKSTIKTDLKYRIWWVPCTSVCHTYTLTVPKWSGLDCHKRLPTPPLPSLSMVNPRTSIDYQKNDLTFFTSPFPLTLFHLSIKYAHVSTILKRNHHHLSFTQQSLQATLLNFAFHFEFPMFCLHLSPQLLFIPHQSGFSFHETVYGFMNC